MNILGWVNMTKHNNILTMDIARLANPGERGGRKPREERGCHLQACASNWFTGEWGTCEAACAEEGERGREVQCLLDGSPATSCRLSERPAIRENCLAACPAEEDTNGLGDILEEREREEVEEVAISNELVRCPPHRAARSQRTGPLHTPGRGRGLAQQEEEEARAETAASLGDGCYLIETGVKRCNAQCFTGARTDCAAPPRR